jgi:hypothetical protein
MSVFRRQKSGLAAGLVLLALALGAAGCGSSSPGKSAASSAGSEASSAVSSALNGASSKLSSAASQASASVSSVLGQVSGAIDATGDVQAGAVSAGSDGKVQTQLTVSNPTADAHDYTIAVTFEDAGGTPQDAVAVNVSAVAAHGTATAIARSNRSLSGAITAKITAALRH